MKKILIISFVILVVILIIFIQNSNKNNNYNNDDNYIEEQEVVEIKELDIDVIENREDELVFSFSINDFIDSYNGYYWQDKKNKYIKPTNEWIIHEYDTSVHSNHKTYYYNYKEDNSIWTLPVITVYVPTDSDYVQGITVNFDDHSFSEEMYILYKEMCYYTLKIFFPEYADEQIYELFEKNKDLAYANIFPNEQGYKNGAIPCELFYKDGIGVYPYFAIGESVRLCIIPVTEETIKDFETKGVVIHEIP